LIVKIKIKTNQKILAENYINVLVIAFLNLERVRGIEPPPQPWEGCILPLNHTRLAKRVILFLTLLLRSNK
jgi:hypothetical protein